MGKVGITVITIEEPLSDNHVVSPEELAEHAGHVKQEIVSESPDNATVTVTVEVRDEAAEGQQKMVLIPESQYEELLNESQFLSCLEAHGVDNWQGYDDARQEMNEE